MFSLHFHVGHADIWLRGIYHINKSMFHRPVLSYNLLITISPAIPLTLHPYIPVIPVLATDKTIPELTYGIQTALRTNMDEW
jgi:hypothetical protein